MSATMSCCQLGIVLIAFQISFFSASVATVPLKCSLPSRSSALPLNLPLAVAIAYAYVSLNPMMSLRNGPCPCPCPCPCPMLVVDDERHHHVDLIILDFPLLAPDVLLFDPRTADVPQRLASPVEALLDCIFEAL